MVNGMVAETVEGEPQSPRPSLSFPKKRREGEGDREGGGRERRVERENGEGGKSTGAGGGGERQTDRQTDRAHVVFCSNNNVLFNLFCVWILFHKR